MRLVRTQKLPAFFAYSGEPRSVRFFWRVKAAEVDRSVIAFYLGGKSWSLASLSDAARQPSIGATAVPFVLLMSCFSQVSPAIVSAIAIFVIDRLRPFAGLHSPDHAMRSVMSVTHVYKIIPPVWICAARSSAGEKSIPSGLRMRILEVVQWARLPRQRARVRVIIETFTQIFCARQPLSHGECIA